MEFFECEKISEAVTKISDRSGVFAYLVEGSQQAALIDTCTGIGSLKELVDGLTEKPVIVLCTHGHIDHAGGAYGFETVYLNEKDAELARVHTSLEFRANSARSAIDEGLLTLADLVPQRPAEAYTNLVDGQVFDLGGLTLEAVALPGHTQGMVCILIRDLRVLLLGDGCNPFTFLFLSESSSVEEYKTSLQSLLPHEDRYDTVWFSHGRTDGPKRIVHDCIELCDDILAGQVDNVPFDFRGMNAVIARAMNPDFSRVDGKVGNIVYNPQRVRADK